MSIQDLIVGLRQGTSGGDTGAIVLVVVGVIALVLVVAVVLALVSARSTSGQIDLLLDERAGTRGSGKWPTRMIVVGVVAAAFIVGGAQMNDPDQCQRCHAEADYVVATAESPHKDISCMSCHGAPGILGTLSEAAAYTRWITVYAAERKDPEPRPGSVSTTQCIRCHDEIVSGVAERYGVRVRHSDFLDEGMGCRDCHGGIAHGDIVKNPTEPEMSACVVCHDGTKASNECEYCHVQDPIAVDAGTRKLPKVKSVDTSNCYACHEEKPCLQCHGVTMPHPAGWAPDIQDPSRSYRTFHARDGFAQRDVCYRCHFKAGEPFVGADEGCSCHGVFGKMHGGTAWVKEHGLQATGQKGGQYAYCYDCHGPNVCDWCHDPSYKERYNPQPGPDSYQRDGDMPYDPDYWEY